MSWKFVLYHCNYVALESFQQISLLCDQTQYILTPDRRKNSLVISLRIKVSYHSSSSSAAVCNQNHISREVLWLCNYCMLLLECISLLHIHWTVWQNHFQCCCTSITNASIVYIVLGPCWHDVEVVICIIVRAIGTKKHSAMLSFMVWQCATKGAVQKKCVVDLPELSEPSEEKEKGWQGVWSEGRTDEVQKNVLWWRPNYQCCRLLKVLKCSLNFADVSPNQKGFFTTAKKAISLQSNGNTHNLFNA